MPSILQLSVLDPAIHTRIYYKIALSLAQAGFEVCVAGTDKVEVPKSLPQNIEIISLPTIPRSVTARLGRGWDLFKVAYRRRPDALMIHTPELLHIVVLYKILFPKTKLFYDVLEDYEKNFRYHPFMRGSIKKIAAPFIRFWEKTLIRFFDAVFYAENCYDNMLGVAEQKKFLLLNHFTNKALSILPNQQPTLPQGPYMLCCGTLNRTWGVKKSLDLWTEFNAIQPLHLIIAGFTYDEETLDMIENYVANSPYKNRFTLVGGNKYVPYPTILYLIQHCSFGTGLYDLPPNIMGKTPTKFYEYLALEKPLLFTSDPYWNSLNQAWNLGIAVSPTDKATDIWQQLQDFSHTKRDPKHYSWEENEEIVLVDVLKKILF